MDRDELLEIIEKAKKEKWRTLDLNHRDIKELPSEIGELVELKELNLMYNQLRELPPEIGGLVNLEILKLGPDMNKKGEYDRQRGYSNKLAELPRKIGQLNNLTYLNLNDNELTELPKKIRLLKKLTHLNLRGNRLRKLPKETIQLKKLTALYLRDNELTEIPKEIVLLNNLTLFDLSDNPLNEFGRNVFWQIKWEKEIDSILYPYLYNFARWWDINLCEDKNGVLAKYIIGTIFCTSKKSGVVRLQEILEKIKSFIVNCSSLDKPAEKEKISIQIDIPDFLQEALNISKEKQISIDETLVSCGLEEWVSISYALSYCI